MGHIADDREQKDLRRCNYISQQPKTVCPSKQGQKTARTFRLRPGQKEQLLVMKEEYMGLTGQRDHGQLRVCAVF